MTMISRARFESNSKALAESLVAGPQRINRANEVHIGKRVEVTAEKKAFWEKSQATATAAEVDAAAFQREFGPRIDDTALAQASATYTRLGKMSTEEEKAAFVQWTLDQYDALETLKAKYPQLVAENKPPASTAEQSGNAPPAGILAARQHRYEENHAIYLPNISDLSFENARKAVGIVKLAIKNHDDVGRTVHGHYGKQPISDLKAYLAALKDHISKIDIGGSLTPSESVKGPTSTGG